MVPLVLHAIFGSSFFLQEKKNLESIIAVTDSKSVYNAFFKLPS